MQINHPPTLISVPAKSSRQFPELPALAHAMDQGSLPLTYGGLWNQIQHGAQSLLQAGLVSGDRVLLAAESSPFWAPAFFSILHAGCVAVPVTADTPPAALGAITVHAGAAAVLVSEQTEAAVRTLGLEGVHLLRMTNLFEARPGSAHASPGSAPELAVLAFTSGSTRQPLAVELTHANLLADLQALLQVRRARPGDTFLSMLPTAHLFELMGGLLGPLACGAKIVYPGSPLPNRLVDSLRNDRITHACCVPGLLQCLYQEVLDELATTGLVAPEHRGQPVAQTAARFESGLDRPALERIVHGVRTRIGSSLSTLVLGGAALDPAWTVILRALGIRAEIGYGLTEASPIVSLGLAGECPPGSVGHPLPGVEVRLGQDGEILLRGPTITRGYHRNPEATRAAFAEGWLRTGDRGVLDPQGFLFITGRLKEAMVTAAGETIYPDELEPYYASPLFAEWCVAGRPGPDGNDIPTLFVIPATAGANEADLAGAFQELRASAPARFRVDRMVCLDQPLPRTALGKPRRRAIVAAWLCGPPTPPRHA